MAASRFDPGLRASQKAEIFEQGIEKGQFEIAEFEIRPSDYDRIIGRDAGERVKDQGLLIASARHVVATMRMDGDFG